jgi:hypothetical protein
MVHGWFVTLGVCGILGVVPGNGEGGKELGVRSEE